MPENKGKKKIEFAVVIECNSVVTYCDGWWIDSGATRYITKMKEGLMDFKVLSKG